MSEEVPTKSRCPRCGRIFGNAIVYCLRCDTYSVAEMSLKECRNLAHVVIDPTPQNKISMG